MGLFDGTPLERPVLCDRCELPVHECSCQPLPEPDVEPNKQRLKLRLEKRKRGKMVTVVTGFRCQKPQLQSVLTKLKDHCGTGGTIDGSNVELQGDQLNRAKDFLGREGYRV